jgi:hypothetical protein
MSDQEDKTMSVAREEALVGEIEGLRKQLEDAMTSNERLRISLELQEKKLHLEKPETAGVGASKIEYGISYNPDNVLDRVAEPFKKEDPGSEFRFISNHPTVRPLRRGQGYEPVKDKDGNEVQCIDVTLAKMPRSRYEQEILAPRKAKKAGGTLKEIAERFHQAGAEAGVKTSGTIKYDSGGKA